MLQSETVEFHDGPPLIGDAIYKIFDLYQIHSFVYLSILYFDSHSYTRTFSDAKILKTLIIKEE